MIQNTEHFKGLLVKEKSALEKELSTLGRKNPSNKEDWETVEPDTAVDPAEDGEVAEHLEKYESDSAVLNNLEIRLNEVKAALAKIEEGTYGVCDVGGEEIEEDRLEANPAATTCKLHMN